MQSVLGQSLGPHDPSCNKFSLALSFVLSFALGLRAEHALCNYMLSFRPEAELVIELSCTCMLHFIFRSPKGAGLVPGVTKYSRGHAEFSAGSEAYGGGFACLLPVASR